MKEKKQPDAPTALRVMVKCCHLRGSSVLLFAGSNHGLSAGTTLLWSGNVGTIKLVERDGAIATFDVFGDPKDLASARIHQCTQCYIFNPRSVNGGCAGCGWVPGSRVNI